MSELLLTLQADCVRHVLRRQELHEDVLCGIDRLLRGEDRNVCCDLGFLLVLNSGEWDEGLEVALLLLVVRVGVRLLLRRLRRLG